MPYRRVGEEIQYFRKKKGLTQEQLAEKVGISTTHMGYIEQGRRKPPLQILKKIAYNLNVQVRDLIKF